MAPRGFCLAHSGKAQEIMTPMMGILWKWVYRLTTQEERIMKKISLLLVVGMVSFAVAQMPPPKPEELKKLEFLIGKFDGKQKMFMDPSQPPTESKGSVESKWILDGRYLSWGYKGDFMGMKMEGFFTITFDPSIKKYIGTWIDNMGNGILVMKGNFEGSKLILTTDEMDVEGMGKVTMRSTYWAIEGGFHFDLDMKRGDQWAPLLQSDFKKK